MTSQVRIELEANPHLPDWWQDVPVVVELIDSQLQTAASLTLIGSASLALEPGHYLVRARLPSGETVNKPIEVRTGAENAFVLHPSHSPDEWLAWQHFLGEAPASLDTLSLEHFPELWLRLWYFENGAWQLQPPAAWRGGMKDAKFALFELDLSAANPREQPQRLRLVQVGGQNVPWRCIAIPPTPHLIQVLLRGSRTPTALNGGLVVKVASLDTWSEALSHYLRSGANTQAETVSWPVMGRAEQYGQLEPTADAQIAEQILRDKLTNPFGAAVGGYYLLRSGEYERLHTWPHNFAEWIPWLPDAALIHAWQLLRQGQPALSPADQAAGVDPFEKARQRLLQAAAPQTAAPGTAAPGTASANLPILTEGVRLLLDGLEVFSLSAPSAELQAAAQRVRALAKAVDWNQRLTTFYGPGPQQADLKPVTGLPADRENLTFV